ncbi:MotA/TolQ/ExbB proton channel family protein [Spartinivicinus poritis]|uniref:MotA/TolQ/ExbB proton channel family protein n=1 Tax=Spartinivicinus poritis TaxID=2994640 RepID=A0ABT5UCZ2_9GAMM|nr:MotA/TolQ/ExbB proton channel family protein [Spartinivicinus sp. A2-2]MDE1464239.1 MotA/TolQ/ExbB proton channel family protein [Spartinivicinus sp. A2-2]
MEGLNLKKYLHTTSKKFDPFALIIGLGGFAAVGYALGLKEDINTFLDLRSLLIVICGTFASILFQFDFRSCASSLKLVLSSFFGTPGRKITNTLIELDRTIIANGKLTELREGESINGELLNDIIYMHKQGLFFEEIDEFVTSRIRDQILKRKVSVDILRRAAIIAPALGLFGTVIGLIGVLRSLNDPSEIGPSMSLALMTTAYGAGLGSIVFTPLSGRLEHHNSIYLAAHEQLLNKIGILIKREENSIDAQFLANTGPNEDAEYQSEFESHDEVYSEESDPK